MLEIIAVVIGIMTGGIELYQHAPHLSVGEVPSHINGEVNPDWIVGCSNAFKSFNADTGLWSDGKQFHYCRLKYTRGK